MCEIRRAGRNSNSHASLATFATCTWLQQGSIYTFMRPPKSAILALTLFGFLAALLILTAIHQSQRPNVAVSFAGYTNSPTGARLAAFRVTNQCSATLWHWADYYVQIRGKSGPAQRPRHFGGEAELGPAESVLYVVPAYTNQPGWRAVLYFSQVGPRLSFMQWSSDHLPDGLRRFIPESLKQVRSWTFESDWIDN